MGRAIHLLTLLVALAVPAAAQAARPAGGDPPVIVPMPAPPSGPAIRRVVHDALQPVEPGVLVAVRVEAEQGARVSVRLGAAGDPVACPPDTGRKESYACTLQVPGGLEGRFHVVAEARGPGGRLSRLGSALPVVVRPSETWETVNALNVRLRPVFFDAGSTAVDAAADAAITTDREILAKAPERSILIEGHCDPSEPGDHDSLSRERAEAVAERLAALGIPRDRVVIAGRGSAVPLVRDGDEQERALNRRVMILFQALEEPPRP